MRTTAAALFGMGIDGYAKAERYEDDDQAASFHEITLRGLRAAGSANRHEF
jgi:hypothetical protein